MASATINGTTSNQYIDSKIEWTSKPTTSTNSSVVTAKLYYKRNNTGYTTSGTGTFTINIGGKKTSKTHSITITGSGWTLAVEGTATINHDSDGSKQITISASGSISSSTLTSTNCSGTATLDKIPRQATITSAPNFTDEENPIIKYSNSAGNSVTTLQACISVDGSKDDVAYRDIPKTGTSYTFKLTDAERKVLRSATKNSKSRTVSFYVRTTIGSNTYHSSVAKTLSIVNANPTFTASQISYADTSAVKDITGNPLHIVQNQSNLSVTFTDATAKKEASISKYAITVNGVTKNATVGGTVTFGKINTSSNTEISITVTDSRGNTTTAKKTATILAWALPTFTASLERLNNYEDETYLTVDASISSVNNKNTMAISYRLKESGGSYGSAGTIQNQTQYTLQLDKNKAYIFAITVADAFDSTTNEFALSKGKFPLFIDTQKNAVGINDFPAEGEALCVAEGVARFDDGIVLLGTTKKFLLTVTDNGTLNIAEMKGEEQ